MKKIILFILLIVANNLVSQNNQNKKIIDNSPFYPKQQFISYTVPISINTPTNVYGLSNGEKNNFKKEDFSLLQQKRLSEYIRKDVVEIIIKKIKSGQISAYDPLSGFGRNLDPSNGFFDCPTKKLDSAFNKEYLQYIIDTDSVEIDQWGFEQQALDEDGFVMKIYKKISIKVEDISSITFYENWYFDFALKNKKPLVKKVLGYTLNIFPHKSVGIVPLVYIKCEDVKEKKMKLIAENYITSTNINREQGYYNYKELFNNNLYFDFRVYLLGSIINLTQKPEVYLSKWNIEGIYNNYKGEFTLSEKLSNKEIISKSRYLCKYTKWDDIDVPALDKNGQIIYEMIDKSYGIRDIINLGFVENWSFDSETLSISKDVKGFMPAVKNPDPINRRTDWLKELFYIKF